jgi:hypothetical protein
MKTIALVELGSGEKFYVEDPPKGNPENWIQNYVYDVDEVEFVEVLEVGKTLEMWSNPDCCSEE